MWFEILTVLAVAAGAASCFGIYSLIDAALTESLRKKHEQLPEGELVPQLPANCGSGPYRQGDCESTVSEEDDSRNISAEDRFRRYAYAFNRLKSDSNQEMLSTRANDLDPEVLINAIQASVPDSSFFLAAVHAFCVRSDPADFSKIIDLLYESLSGHVDEAVLTILNVRGPVNDTVISLVFDIATREFDRVDDEDDDEEEKDVIADDQLVQLAEKILSEWEQQYPDVMQKFALLK
ncbi:MAG: hypothetical protein V1738_02855 [Patescibacteria group bacterium]